jgi:hypothetical protein
MLGVLLVKVLHLYHPSPDGRRMLPHPALAKFYNTL